GPTDRLGIAPVSPSSGPYQERLIDGDLYVVPMSAARQAATDPDAFDVSAKLRGTATAPRSAQPNYPMRTVTLDVTDDRGDPASLVSLVVLNVDDSRKYQGSPTVIDGVAKISAPDGHYALLASQEVDDAEGAQTAEKVVFVDFTVDGAATTVSVDLRAATHLVSVSTPRAAAPVEQDLVWFRGSSDEDGVADTIGALSGDVSLYLGSSAPAYGVQHLAIRQRLESPIGVAHPYLYDVRFPTEGAIGDDQHYQVRSADLTTVNTSYSSDVPERVGMSLLSSLLPWEPYPDVEGNTVTQPLRRTEYLTATDSMVWKGDLFTSEGPGFEQLSGGYHSYRPGQHTVVSWLAGPVTPSFPTDTGLGWYGCPACREGDTLSLSVSPLSDAEPDHSGGLAGGRNVTSISRLRLYQDGNELADVPSSATEVTVPPDPAGYRLVYDQTRITPTTHLSTSAHVEWAFHSRHSASTTVPSRWSCSVDHPGDCSAVSLLTLNYRLRQTLSNSVHPGASNMRLAVAHTSGTPALPIRTAALAVSFDRGQHWIPASVARRQSNTFEARWTTPPSAVGSTISLRATASDSMGNTILETVLDAVAVS
ncbi:MAG: hypothetical protein J2P17_21185, partial [Mycobacterium sp.]|nr:hypothetical protein [Mycobacterium sp.]